MLKIQFQCSSESLIILSGWENFNVINLLNFRIFNQLSYNFDKVLTSQRINVENLFKQVLPKLLICIPTATVIPRNNAVFIKWS